MRIEYARLKPSRFDPVFLPEKELQSFLADDMDAVFFHRTKGAVLFSSTMKRLWPEIVQETTEENLMGHLERLIVPVEKFHFSSFREKRKNHSEDADVFVLKENPRAIERFYGFKFLECDAGSLAIVIPGNNTEDIANKTARMKTWDTTELKNAMNRWTNELEKEYLTSVLIDRIEQENIRSSMFSRPIDAPLSPDKTSLGYRKTGDSWIREQRNYPDPMREGRKRHMGRVRDGEVIIDFSVFVGGVEKLGTLSIKASLVNERYLDGFLRRGSDALCQEAASLSGQTYHYAKFWNGRGFNLNGIDEIIHKIDPVIPETIQILLFRFENETLKDAPQEIESINKRLYTTDVIFSTPDGRYGAIVLGHIDKEKAMLVRDKIKKAAKTVSVKEPETIGWYYPNIAKQQRQDKVVIRKGA